MFGTRYVCVRQADGSDCGAASLATIALHYKRPLSVQRVRELAGTDQEGTTLQGLMDAAERLGFQPQAVKATLVGLCSAPLPAIAHIVQPDGRGHFVVVHRCGRRHVVVADPERGICHEQRADFEAMWSGYLLLMSPVAVAPIAAAERPVSSWWRLVGLMSQHRGLLGEALVCALIVTLLSMSTSYFVRHLVDSVLVQGETRLLNAFGVAMLGIAVFQTVFGVVRQYMLAYVGRKIDIGLVSSYTRHLLGLPMSFFEMRRAGDIFSRVNDAGKIREAISGTTLTTIVDGVMVVLSSAVLWMYDVRMAALATLFAPCMAIVVAAHHTAAQHRSRKAMEAGAGFSAHLIEDVSGIETIKAIGIRRLRNVESDQRLARMANADFSISTLGIGVSSLTTIIGITAGVVILWYGGHRVAAGAMTVGQLMFFHTLLGNILEPMKRLAGVNLQLQEALVAVDRLYQVVDLETERDLQGTAHFNGLESDITLKNVSFRYGCRQSVLNDLTLRIPAGATVALVGESGCGKSTLLKLLLRFYDPTEGAVLIDGMDARDFDLDSLRSRIGVVSQDVFIFDGTLQENISLGSPGATMQQVMSAAQAAGLAETIAEMPERYKTRIGERGSNLSGGQRQRLSIARALLRQPDILILDEATSHLDARSEFHIQTSLTREFEGKTVIVVAHRLSTIRHANIICCMHQGSIVEMGTHDELLELDGRYAEQWRTQSGLALGSQPWVLNELAGSIILA